MHSWTIRLRDVRHLLKRAKELELSDGAVQRLKWFAYALEHDGNVSLTCRRFGIARSTFLRWAERFDAKDIRTIEEESRRPHTVRAPETAPHVVALIRQIRQEHPLMGKDAVATLLRSQYGIDVSASTVGRTIARHGLFFAGTKAHEQKRAAAPSPIPSAQVDDAAGSSPFPMLPTIGTTLALMLSVIGACLFPNTVQAAQSNNFMLQETGPGHAAGVPHGSTNYQMQGDLTWRQEVPLHSNSFTITNAPAPQASSAVATSSAQSSVSTPDDGGHRGEGTTTTNPPSSRSSSSVSSAPSSAASSAPAVTTSSASSKSSSVVTSEDLRPAAEASSSSAAAITSSVSSAITSISSASSSSTSIRSVTSSCGYMDDYTVLCDEPFYHPIVLAPVPSGTPAQSIAESIVTEYATLTHGSVVVSLALLLLLAIMLSAVVGYFNSKASESTRFVRNAWYVILVAFAAITIVFFTVQHARAAVSSPQRHVYNGHLLNASGTPITTPHYIRFSEWYNRDMDPTDVVSGVINTGAATYAGYQEVHVVTPDSQGYFSVILGTGAALPNLAALATSDLDNLFLQVEVKVAGSLDSAYELLDVNPSDTTIDRSPILSVPFAQNADLLDQREIGTGSGSIPLLGSGGLLPVATVPGGTNRDTFTIDANNTAASLITLQFGQALAKTLSYDIVNDRFTFNADVRIEGDLTVTGLINGVDITAIASDSGKLRVSSGAGLTINVTGGAYRINGDVTDYAGASGVAVPASATSYVFIGSGGLTVRTMSYPTDESFIRLATVVTNGSAVTQVNDHRVAQSDDREETTEANMHAEFTNVSYQADATENTGQLSVSLDNITLRNFYLWTSTRTTLQDYDVVVRVSLPADFVRWDSAPMSVSYRTTSADTANSKVDVSLFDTNGTAVTLGGSATGLASTSWATSALTFGNGATWTPGSEFLVKFKLYAKDNYQSHVGSMKLKYVRLVP